MKRKTMTRIPLRCLEETDLKNIGKLSKKILKPGKEQQLMLRGLMKLALLQVASQGRKSLNE